MDDWRQGGELSAASESPFKIESSLEASVVDPLGLLKRAPLAGKPGLSLYKIDGNGVRRRTGFATKRTLCAFSCAALNTCFDFIIEFLWPNQSLRSEQVDRT